MSNRLRRFIKDQALKEIKALNVLIDEKIKEGKNYKQEAVEHKVLLKLITS